MQVMRLTLFAVLAFSAAAQTALDSQRVAELARTNSAEQLDSIICSATDFSFSLTPAAMSALIQAGVSEQTIKAMAAKQAGGPCKATEAVQPVQATAVQAQPVQERPPAIPASHALPSSNPPSFPAVSLYGGYSYASVDTNGLDGRVGGNGFEGSAALRSLIGKKAIAQRVPFYEPGTYKIIPNTYAGQAVTIIAFKPISVPRTLTAQQLARLGAQARAMIEDAQNSGTVVVQFADGTKADTGVILPSLLGNYLELLEPAPAASTPAASPSQVGERSSAAPSATVPSVRNDMAAEPLSSDVSDFLSPKEIEAAKAGSGEKQHVHLTDAGGNFLRDFAANYGNDYPVSAGRGAGIDVYSSSAIIGMGAKAARRNYSSYEPTVADTQRALIVYAEGWVGPTIGIGCQAITRVILLSGADGQVVEEAYLSEPSDDVWRNAFGTANNCQTLRAGFSMESVKRVRMAARKGEFLIVVFSGSARKTYKLTQNRQAQLGL
jgi:hypothetical protein